MPAVANFVLDKGFDASAAILKFRAVKPVAAQPDQVAPVTALGDVVVGVEQFGVTSAEILKGKGASVRIQGITEMEASEAIAIGAPVGIAADGRAAATIAAGTRVIGVCMFKGAGAAGDRCSVLLAVPGRLFTAGS
jgi:uncharacterized protein DUF2190